MYSKEDYWEIMKLVSLSIISKHMVEEMDAIFRLYKTYIDARQKTYLDPSKCGKCGNSISRLFTELSQWFNLNQDKFEK